MILRQFASNSPFLLLIAPAISFGGLLAAGYGRNMVVKDSRFPLDTVLEPLYAQQLPLLIVTATLISGGAILLNYVFNRFEFHSAPSHIPALFYSLAATTFCFFHIQVPLLVAHLFIGFGLVRLLHVYRQTRVLSHYFESALAFGMAALIYPPYVSLLPGLLLCVMYTRTFNWREFVVSLLGFLFPFVFWVTWKFWNREMNDLILFRGMMDYRAPLFSTLSLSQRSMLIASAVIFLLSLPGFFFKTESTKSRNTRSVSFIISISRLVSILFSKQLPGLGTFAPALLPSVFIVGAWFSNYRYSLIAPVAFYGLLGINGWMIFQWIVSH